MFLCWFMIKLKLFISCLRSNEIVSERKDEKFIWKFALKNDETFALATQKLIAWVKNDFSRFSFSVCLGHDIIIIISESSLFFSCFFFWCLILTSKRYITSGTFSYLRHWFLVVFCFTIDNAIVDSFSFVVRDWRAFQRRHVACCFLSTTKKRHGW